HGYNWKDPNPRRSRKSTECCQGAGRNAWVEYSYVFPNGSAECKGDSGDSCPGPCGISAIQQRVGHLWRVHCELQLQLAAADVAAALVAWADVQFQLHLQQE